ncbi:MAG: hypothetical protein CTY15_03970 [Methylocystis sp.]|nr:MAG: hypothetical protein CTY15_03970 [Methylocystis sp.]
MSAMNCQVTRIQLVIKTRKSLLVRGHASFGLQRNQHVANRHFSKFGQNRQFLSFTLRQCQAIADSETL